MELYLNYASHHPLAKGVADKLYNKMPYLYNPSDNSDIAESAKLILRKTRHKLYDMLNTDESKYNIIFTSSGSESNNTVLNGIDYDCLYTTNAEHSSIMERLKNDLRFRENIFIKSDGSTIDYNWLNVNLEDDNTSNLQDLVSVQWVNNETGHINNVKKISEIVHNNGHLFHVDAVQAFGKMPIDLSKLDVDFMSISGHKIGAFSGVGVLVAKKGVRIDPLIYGHQEFGMRGGTENIIGIASLDYALDTVDYSQETMEKHEAMNKAICDGLFKRGLDYRIIAKVTKYLIDSIFKIIMLCKRLHNLHKRLTTNHYHSPQSSFSSNKQYSTAENIKTPIRNSISSPLSKNNIHYNNRHKTHK